MDKTTRTQFSLVFFIVGFFLILVGGQDLNRLQSINLGFTLPYAIMFYLGLIFIAVGFYLK